MKNITCSACNSSVSSPVSDDTIFRGYALCPDCLEQIPESIANTFLTAAENSSKKELCDGCKYEQCGRHIIPCSECIRSSDLADNYELCYKSETK